MRQLAALILVTAMLQPVPARANASAVVEWNAALLETAEAEDGFLTLKGVRAAAMMHIAMHDALAAIEPRYAAYRYRAQAPGANPLVAAVHAAFAVASDQYPEQRPRFSALRDRQLASLAQDSAYRAATDLGMAAAAAILDARRDDGWNSDTEYRWHPMGPGVYAEFNEHSGTPRGFVFGAGWAAARPFALREAGQYRAPPPPAIGSDAYTLAFDEVKSVGRYQSMQRTPDQTHLALWWKDFAENSHNRLARDLVEKEALPLQPATRLFALINIGIFDGYVSVFENKFHFNFWRPYTAIRQAETDGNPATQAEANWTNTHRHTYAFPSYPSAHGTVCAAAMSALADTFGTDYPFTMRIPRVDIAGPFSGKFLTQPPTRQFPDFASAAAECGLSRVYLGIHFRFDSVEGVRLGERIGDYVIDHFLQAAAPR